MGVRDSGDVIEIAMVQGRVRIALPKDQESVCNRDVVSCATGGTMPSSSGLNIPGYESAGCSGREASNRMSAVTNQRWHFHACVVRREMEYHASSSAGKATRCHGGKARGTGFTRFVSSEAIAKVDRVGDGPRLARDDNGAEAASPSVETISTISLHTPIAIWDGISLPAPPHSFQ